VRIFDLSLSPLDKSIQQFILVAPVLLFSMVAHEYAHGYAALKQGDTTAYSLGRLTWNPIPHIDLFMTILLPLLTFFTTGIAFGGAKPVPVIPRNYRNFKRGDIIVSLAGVVTNFIIAFCCIPLIVLVGFLGRLSRGCPTQAPFCRRCCCTATLRGSTWRACSGCVSSTIWVKRSMTGLRAPRRRASSAV